MTIPPLVTHEAEDDRVFPGRLPEEKLKKETALVVLTNISLPSTLQLHLLSDIIDINMSILSPNEEWDDITQQLRARCR